MFHDSVEAHERRLGGTATHIQVDGRALERHDGADGCYAFIDTANRFVEMRVARSRKGTRTFEVVLGIRDGVLSDDEIALASCVEGPAEPKKRPCAGLVPGGMPGLQFQKATAAVGVERPRFMPRQEKP